jgi:hypothetical protein
MQPDRQVTELRRRLRRAGFDPLPLDGKRPPMPEWQKQTDSNDDTIGLWGTLYPHSTNTGALTKRLPTLDLDILNPEAAEAAGELVREKFEERGYVLTRIGLAPKRAILFRTDEPFAKIAVNLVAPNGGEEERVEFLADGQQVACFGIHPDTKRPYAWHGGEPGQIAREDLPYIRETDARQLVDEIVELLIREHGYQRKTEAKGNGKEPDDGAREKCDWGKFGDLLDHDNVVSVAMALIRGGLGKEAAYNLLCSQIEAIDTPDTARKQRRLDEMRGVIDSAAGKAGKVGEPPKLESTRASNIEIAAIEWLWPDRFAIGKLGLLVGLPDEGKGQILADMAARVTRGAEWPCDEGRAPQGNIVLLSAEDDAGDTVVPRLVAADANLDRVEIVNMVRDASNRRMFSIGTDLPLLREKIVAVGGVKLVIIDPISAYLGVGKVDSFRNTDVRAVLAPLVDLAAELKVAVVGIMHFNKKTDVTNALLRISDSLAFGATARHVYAVIDDAENKRKLLVRGKNNLAKTAQKSLAYNFGQRDVGTDKATGAIINAPHIIWHPQHVDVTAVEAMTATKSPAARDEAKKFIVDYLAAGPVSSTDVEEAAKANGISRRTLFRAKTDLGVAAKKSGDGWTWQVPAPQYRRGADAA